MTDSEFLFFDIECANCFGGNGKICSFGYAVCDDKFNIIECDDIVINPESRFDWAFFSNKFEIKLAYPKQTFLAAPTFPHFYPRIQRLLSEHSGHIVGFAPKNDIGFLDYTCRRYGLTLPKTLICDLVSILRTRISHNMRLIQWADELGVDKSGLTAHNSMDDAKMTMLVLKSFCERYGISADEAVRSVKSSLIDTAQYLHQKAAAKQSKEYRLKIRQLYKATHIIKEDKLHGQRYYIMLPKNVDVKSEYELALRICQYGGIVVPKIRSNVIIVADDNRTAGLVGSEIASYSQGIIGKSELDRQLLSKS